MQKSPRNTSIFDFLGKPSLAKALPISLQHVLAMVAGVITPPIIIPGVAGAITAFVLNIVLPRSSLADEAREREEIARPHAEAAGRAEEPSLS